MKTNIVLKIISFILLPILCVGIVGSVFVLNENYKNEQINEQKYEEYSEESKYADRFIFGMSDILSYYQNNKFNIKEIGNSKITRIDTIYQSNYPEYYTKSNLQFLIVDIDGTMLTNISNIENVEDVSTNIKNEDYYYILKENEKETNVNIASLINRGKIIHRENTEGIKEFYVYTDLDSIADYFNQQKEYEEINKSKVNDFVVTTTPYAIPTLVLSMILALLIAIYLLFSIGYKKGYEGIYLSYLDKIPLEIFWGLGLAIFAILMGILDGVYSHSSMIRIIFSIIICSTIYTLVIAIGVSTLKRIKSKTILKNTLTYKFFKSIFKPLNEFILNMNTTYKIVSFSIGCTICGGILLAITVASRSGFMAFISFIVFLTMIYYIIKKSLEYIKLKKQLKNIYEGKISIKLNSNEFNGEFKEIANYLNDISSGFSNAIEESLKTERLKTELITNVSHDIKTPLTSIINYVDLLKKEELNNAKATEYLDILENKSNRLKKLTEDLIEASKATSGNIKLSTQDINVVELISQLNAEFEEKFKLKNLELITSIPDEEFVINADGKYMYRIFENLYSNITKYALTNSRVYLDMKKEGDIVNIQLKNISDDKLNISADELMERFTRGDIARTTEGSGLGISIAKSLTELQGGRFSIILDGDLFKVVLEF